MPINTYAPEFAALLDRQQKVRDFAAGPSVVKAATTKYLPRLPGQRTFITSQGVPVDPYDNYLFRAVVLPFVAPLLSRLVGMLFRKAPSFAVPESVQRDLSNLTLTAPECSAEAFARRVATEALVGGGGVIAVDYDERRGRPVQRLYGAGSILGVEHAMVGAASQPRRVRVLEKVAEADPQDPYVEAIVEQVAVLELTDPGNMPLDEYPLGYLQVQKYRKQIDRDGKRTGAFEAYGDPTIPIRLGKPLAFLPMVPFTAADLVWTPAPPPLEVLVDLLHHYYLVSADWRQLLHACAGAVGFAAGFNQDEAPQLGGFGGLQWVIASDPSARLELKQVSGESSDQLVAALGELKHNMALAVGRLLMSQSKNVAESGAALELQFSGDDANLQRIGATVATALEAAMRIHAWWSGAAETSEAAEVSVNLADSFVARRISPQELQALTLAMESGNFTDVDRFWNLKQAEALAPQTTFESWQADRGDGMAPSSIDLGEVRRALAALKSAGTDPDRVMRATQALDVLLSDLPAEDDAA